jgi:hypothetical protein
MWKEKIIPGSNPPVGPRRVTNEEDSGAIPLDADVSANDHHGA